MAVLLSPGQGAQQPGLLTPWLELPGARDRLDRWSEAAGLDLLAAGTCGTAEQIRDTAVAQPLLTAAALLSGRALLDRAGPSAVALVCGHSVGELSALALAGGLDDTAAVALAAARGRAMADAAGRRPTGLTAVLGGDPDEVAAAAARHGLTVATVNVPGQVVLGGAGSDLLAFAAAPPAGARLRPLPVAGAFHTRAMEPAVPAFAAALAGVDLRAPQAAVVANADGAVIRDPAELRRRLLAQLTGPVRFDACLEQLAAAAPAAVVELAPGNTLLAMARRALPQARLVALRGPADLDAACAAAQEAVPA